MKKREKYVYITLSIVALLLFSLMNYIKGGAFDFDEVFSLAMIDHSFADMWLITARDYHPPLSYFILKVLSWFVRPFSDGNLEIYRTTAILGYFMIILLCIFPVRRLWGFRVSVIAILLFIFMPISFYIYSNFRMYAWAAPLVLATFIYAYDSFQSNSRRAWMKLTLVASAAMYMHYYALISTFVVYVFLFVAIVLSKRSTLKSQLTNYLVSGFILILLYAPWLYFFIGQLAEVKNDYWIGNPAISDIAFAIQYYFVPKYYTEKYTSLLSSTWLLAVVPLLLLTVVAIIGGASIQLKNKAKQFQVNRNVAFAAFGVLLVSLAMVMIYTFTVSPVYHIRYLMCYFGLFVLGLSLCISILLEKKQFVGNVLIGSFVVFLLFDFALCFHFNIARSGFCFSKSNDVEVREMTIEEYYSDEDSFTDMAYLSVLHPTHKYFLVTDDNPKTRKVIAPYISNDTVCVMPFSNVSKVKSLEVNHPFLYMSKENPKNDIVFSAKYQVVDSVYSGLYRVEPIQ